MIDKNNDFEQIIVNDKHSFIDFIRLLRESLENDINSWENTNLSGFLEAIERYTEDIQGYYDNTGQSEEDANQASWKRFADILKGARVYE